MHTGDPIFHNDRGSQYASRLYTELLAEHGMKASMSGKGNCWDNACSATLFGSLKVERLHGMEFHNHSEAKNVTSTGCSGTTDQGCTPPSAISPAQPA